AVRAPDRDGHDAPPVPAPRPGGGPPGRARRLRRSHGSRPAAQGRLGGGDPVDVAAEGQGVQLAVGVGPERAQAGDLEAEVALLGHLAAGGPGRPDPARAVVAVQVGALQARNAPAPVDEPADHGAAVVAAVLDHRVHGAVGPITAVEGVAALAPVPAVVAPTRTGRLVVDLLVGVLADVADPQVAGGGVERETPGVAQPVVPDLGPGPVAVRERVAGRDPIGLAPAGPRVDPE